MDSITSNSKQFYVGTGIGLYQPTNIATMTLNTDDFWSSWYKNPKIKKVIFNNPATIIPWDDGTKTVVKCQDEPFDAERGMAMAIAKKFFGNKGRYNNEFKKWIGERSI